jgi:LysM repeat protein
MAAVYELRDKTQESHQFSDTVLQGKRPFRPRGVALAIEVGKCEPFFMRQPILTLLSALLICWSLPVRADSIELREIRELRQIVEQQSKQIEALTQKVTELHKAFDQQKASSPSSASTPPSPSAGPLAEHSASAPAPAAAPVPSAPPSTPPTTEAPRAEAVAKHTVAKGETLTSIAKLYNITVTELQKLNKIENDRKLQIGQTLTIPKPAETTSSEKKENP